MDDLDVAARVAEESYDLGHPGGAGARADAGARAERDPARPQRAEVDARADIYALGCVLYRALTGAVLYDKDSDVEKMWAHIHEPPPDLLDVRPELPASLGDALERALAKLPDDRQQTVGELAHEVLAAVAE